LSVFQALYEQRVLNGTLHGLFGFQTLYQQTRGVGDLPSFLQALEGQGACKMHS